MNTKELIASNNNKRKQLTKENRKYYERMLVYIRLSHNKSVQETEEILNELLDHLLEAQTEYKTAEDVFGHDPKMYADEIIGELPKIVTKKKMLIITMGILYFLATATVFSGIFNLLMGSVIHVEGFSKPLYLGSVVIKIIISVPLTFLLIIVLFQYVRWSIFKKINKIIEIVIFLLYGVIAVAAYTAIILLIPNVGHAIELTEYVVILSGVVVLIMARIIQRQIME